MVCADWLRNVGIQNLLSGQHFHRSLYGWTKLLQIAQNKDGGKILLNFLGMSPGLVIPLQNLIFFGGIQSIKVFTYTLKW